jgi:hypothetical protein
MITIRLVIRHLEYLNEKNVQMLRLLTEVKSTSQLHLGFFSHTGFGVLAMLIVEDPIVTKKLKQK